MTPLFQMVCLNVFLFHNLFYKWISYTHIFCSGSYYLALNDAERNRVDFVYLLNCILIFKKIYLFVSSKYRMAGKEREVENLPSEAHVDRRVSNTWIIFQYFRRCISWELTRNLNSIPRQISISPSGSLTCRASSYLLILHWYFILAFNTNDWLNSNVITSIIYIKKMNAYISEHIMLKQNWF